MSWTRKLLPRSLKPGLSWTRKLFPHSLRSRLIVSFGLLIFLSLFLAGTTTVYLLRQQQERIARERVGFLAEPVAQRAFALELQGLTPQQMQTQLQRDFDVRILLVDDSGIIVSDSDRTLEGKQIAHRPASPSPDDECCRYDKSGHYQSQAWKQGEDNLLLFSAPTVGLRIPGIGVLTPTLEPVIAVPASNIQQAWRDLLPRLFLAGGIAFAASVFAAGILARSIARPLRRITAASEEMAQGRYDQQLPAYGGDEIGRLASSFNYMASQVSHSNRTLRDFLANVSHELKTPLTSIQGFSQAMVDGSLQKTDDYREAGRIINDEAVRMRGLVDDLLYLSQVEAGETVMHFDRMSPNELLEATRDRFARRARQAEVRLVVSEQPSTPIIEADPRRIEQALANIVENAVRHTPKGGTVTLQTSASDDRVELRVHNTGSFIPPDALPLIFDRFFQVNAVRSRMDGNTGLGMAITKEIVEAHGGVVTVSSSAETGTEFRIQLPVTQAGTED